MKEFRVGYCVQDTGAEGSVEVVLYPSKKIAQLAERYNNILESDYWVESTAGEIILEGDFTYIKYKGGTAIRSKEILLIEVKESLRTAKNLKKEHLLKLVEEISKEE
jgi:hypothetical protein